MDKGGGAVRPIAIGEALRRIAARVVCVQDNAMVADTLRKVQQFGVAVKGGIEYAYASVRIHMLSSFAEQEEAANRPNGRWDLDEIPGALKADFKNGYNSTCRAKMLAEVQARFPKMLRFVRFLYADSPLFVVMSKGKEVVKIATKYGTQQGDPLGGHLFALSLHKFEYAFRPPRGFQLTVGHACMQCMNV